MPRPFGLIAVLMPMTWPRRSKSGPPLFPGLMAASVWMKSSYGPAPMARLLALTMPMVTVFPRPNGLPMATTYSPTRIGSLWPRETVGMSAGAFCSSRTARSRRSSRPFTLASNSRSSREADLHLRRVLDDVRVGENVSLVVDDEARAERALLLHRVAVLTAAPARIASAEGVEGGRAAFELHAAHFVDGGDGDDAGFHLGHEGGDVRRAGEERRAGKWRLARRGGGRRGVRVAASKTECRGSADDGERGKGGDERAGKAGKTDGSHGSEAKHGGPRSCSRVPCARARQNGLLAGSCDRKAGASSAT